MVTAPDPSEGQKGVAVDVFGNPTMDPTSNVFAFVGAAVKRLDDLREAEARRVNEKIIDEASHSRELATLRATYDEKLDIAEAKRIDAIRAVDVSAVAVAAERAAAAAGVLANQVATSADQLRTLVQTQAVTVATAQQQLIEPIMTRIAAMERSMYEASGKSGVTDPQMAQLLIEMRAMREATSQGTGAKQGATDQRVLLFGLIAAAAAVVGVMMAFAK